VIFIAIAFVTSPLFMHSSILGDQTVFNDCVIRRLDHESGKIIESKETIELVPVNHGVHLIEAETYEGGLYGLGFLQAKERLWQMHFFRLLA
jgi:acyl-homoserine lactone acylase PvdQ